MDNQNANNGGYPQDQDRGQKTSKKSTTLRSRFVLGRKRVENARTQSMVESPHDAAERELTARESYNNQIIKEQRAAARRNMGARIAIKVSLVIIVILIFIALIWLIVQIFINVDGRRSGDPCTKADGSFDNSCCGRSEYRDSIKCKDISGPAPSIEGYQCVNHDCRKMADIVKDEKIIIYDENYYIYNIKANSATMTAIDNSVNYISMSAFEWGKDKYYIILTPTSGQTGLFSIDDNRQVIPNKISKFYSDINHQVYADMTDVFGKYIIVRESDQYRLYDVRTGDLLASANSGIFVYKNYIVSYNAGGVRQVYNLSRKRLFVTQPTDEIYVSDNYIIHNGRSLTMYDNEGAVQSVSTNNDLAEIAKVEKSELATYFEENSKKYYHIPISRSYTDQ